jgi:NTE family protein
MKFEPLKILTFTIILFICSYTQGQQQVTKRPKVGLVLSGGGAKGIAHIGVLKVLEQAGMPIDYIGGTSMGSIIAGLYSIGYSADSIAKMVKSLDWPKLLADRFPRNYLSFEEKEKDGKFFIPYPVNEGKFQLPSGVIPAQNLELLLNKLMWNAKDINDFNQLPIPFLCVATNIETGEAVTFRNGSLPKVIRASMAIPTVFTPIIIDGKIFVDGGVINNFPVEEVKNMGADIIIGVDVGFEPYDLKNLNSMLRLIEQSVFIHTTAKNLESRKKCDVFVFPELSKYNMSSFEESDSLIKSGEVEALKQFDKIKALADSIKAIGEFVPHKKLENNQYINIVDIKVVGNKHTPRHYILTKLNLEAPSMISANELEDAVMRVYGSLLYQKVSYKVTKVNEGYEVIIEVSERSQSFFSVGINYNTDFNASIFFNTSLHNILIPGTKLMIDGLLGENPRLNATYFLFSGWNPGGIKPNRKAWRWDFGTNANIEKYMINSYLKGDKILSTRLIDFTSSLFTQTIFKNSYAWGIGVQYNFTSLRNDIAPEDEKSINENYINGYTYIKFDTYNKSYFPEKGIQLDIKVNYVSNVGKKGIEPITLANGKYNFAIPLAKRLSIISGVYAGISFADTVPMSYLYKIGGLNSFIARNSYSFVGYNFLELKDLNVIAFRFNMQYEVFKKNYIVLKSNVAQMASTPDKLLSNTKYYFGYGVSYGYNSIIGPLEFTVMSSPYHKWLLYLNIGFLF